MSDSILGDQYADTVADQFPSLDALAELSGAFGCLPDPAAARYRAGQLAEQRHQADDPTVPDLAAYIAVIV